MSKMTAPLLSLVVLMGPFTMAQDFAPLGATWHYNMKSGSAPHWYVSFVEIEATKDTLFQGVNCRVLEKSTLPQCHGRTKKEYLYQSNDTVFFWDFDLQEFEPIIVYNATPNDQWEFQFVDYSGNRRTMRVSVDSISMDTYNGQSLRSMHVTYQALNSNWTPTHTSKIVERLGDTTYLFNYWNFSNCDITFGAGLRCYTDSIFGSYNSQQYSSCTYNNIGVPEKETQPFFNIYPNPANGSFRLSYQEKGKIHLRIMGPSGLTYLDRIVNPAHQKIDVSHLSAGIYIVRIQTDSWSGSQRLIIERGGQ